jgi:hypothetical protein
VFHHAHLVADDAMLPPGYWELSDSYSRMKNEDSEDPDADNANEDGVTMSPTGEESELKKARDVVHGVLAKQDTRDEKEVNPHENSQYQTRQALGHIEPRGHRAPSL